VFAPQIFSALEGPGISRHLEDSPRPKGPGAGALGGEDDAIAVGALLHPEADDLFGAAGGGGVTTGG
jgi:hypothetical protein